MSRAARSERDGSIMLPFSFSTGLDPEHHRQAVSIEKLMSDYGLSRDQLVWAAENETDGYVFRDYSFYISFTVEKEHSRDNEDSDTPMESSSSPKRRPSRATARADAALTSP